MKATTLLAGFFAALVVALPLDTNSNMIEEPRVAKRTCNSNVCRNDASYKIVRTEPEEPKVAKRTCNSNVCRNDASYKIVRAEREEPKVAKRTCNSNVCRNDASYKIV